MTVSLKAILPVLLLAFSLSVSAQNYNRYAKWGRVPSADLALTACPTDPESPAMVLHDVGSTRIDNNSREIMVLHTRFRRFKIFRTEDFDQSLLNIVTRAGRSGELLKGLEVQHILPNGKVQKVSTDNIFSEQLNEYWKAKKIFVPNLQPGSIVEYRYEITSTYIISLYDWFFHDQLPVRWSEITTTILPYFSYKTLMMKYKPFEVEERGSESDGSVWLRLGMADLPAMKPEPFMTSLDRYRASIRFQLSSINVPGEMERKVMSTWAKSADDLENDLLFGKQYDKKGNFNTAWAAFKPLLSPDEAPETVAQKALRFVSENLRWNGHFTPLVQKDGDLDNAFRNKSGTSADLNLLLVALLQKADLDAVPVLVSTREHGETFEEYPFLDQFNSVVVLIRVNGKNIFLDASRPYQPLNQLAPEHCNGRGWVVDRKNPNFVDLPTPETTVVWFGDAEIKPNGSVTGHFSMSSTGLYAANWRAALETMTPEQFANEQFGARHPGMVCDSAKAVLEPDYQQPAKVTFHFQMPSQDSTNCALLYVSPIFDFFVHENPFKSQQRDFPVNFTCPIYASYMLSLTLPEGYVVEEMPQSHRTTMPNKGGTLLFSCQKQDERHLQLVLRINMAQAEYGPQDYRALRQYFDLAVEKANLKLVLKKA